ncbi:MAG: ABC transporter permease [Candidatus Hydrothermarchaeota archaeon]|nr:ABC transporter permease [Candidatus Hydrothermarchaeota archaeon]MDP6612605.1 ABC transporter permease [Candidatus Hydrothermarchaeota archaeon]
MEFLSEGFLRAIELILSGDPYVMSVTAVSLKISGTAVILSTIASIPLALLISTLNFSGKQSLLTLINTAMGLPPVVVGLVVFLILVPAGPLGLLQLIFTPTAMIIAQFILVTPIITGVSIASINAVDKAVRDTAFTLGGTKKDVAITIVKEARFGIIIAVLAGFGRAIAEVGAILIAGGNIAFWDATTDSYTSYTRTLTTAITLETSKGDISTSIALGIIVLSIVFSVNLFVNRVQKRE